MFLLELIRQLDPEKAFDITSFIWSKKQQEEVLKEVKCFGR